MKLFLFALSFFFYLPSLHAFKITSDQDIRHLLMIDSGFSNTIQAESLLRSWGRVRIKSVSCDQKTRKCLKEDFERNGIPESAVKGNKWFCSMMNYKVEFIADGYDDKIRKMSFSLIFPDTAADSGFSCVSIYKKIKAGPYPVNFRYKKESVDNF